MTTTPSSDTGALSLSSQRFDLSALQPEERALLERLGKRVQAPARTVLIEENAPATSLYLIVDGEVVVGIRAGDGTLVLTHVRRGEFLGETAWFTGAPRSAKVRTLTAVELLEFDSEALTALRAENPALAYRLLHALATAIAYRVHRLARQQFWLIGEAERRTATQDAGAALWAIPARRERRTDTSDLRPALDALFALRGLPLEAVEPLLETAQVLQVQPGDVLFRQDEAGDSLLLPVTAELEAIVSFPGRPSWQLGVINPGEFAGEASLFAGGLRSASVATMVGGYVLVLDRGTLPRMQALHPAAALALLDHLCTLMSRRVIAANAVLKEAVEGQAPETVRHLVAQLALRPRWTQDDVDWSRHEPLPARTARLMARFFADLERAEESAEWLAAGLVEEAGRLVPPELYRAFYIRQHDEEALHAITLDRYAALLGGADGGSAGFAGLLRLARLERDLDERLLLLFLGEELALLTFNVLAQSFPDPVLRQIVGLIAVDESTHVAFGHRLVQRLLAERSRRQRLRLVRRLFSPGLIRAIMRAFWDYRGLSRASGFSLLRLYILYGRVQFRRTWSIVMTGSFRRVGVWR